MSVRKREWGGAQNRRVAWVVDYKDGQGKRRHKTFKLKAGAVAFAAKVNVEVSEGRHVPDSASVTVKAAGDKWLASCEHNRLERSTIAQYKAHLKHHLVPLIGQVKLSKITVPFVRELGDRLRAEPVQTDKDKAPRQRSEAMVSGVIGSLGALLADAQERGEVAHNAVREMRNRRRLGKGPQDRHNRKLKVGLDIPRPDEVKALLAAARELQAKAIAENEGRKAEGKRPKSLGTVFGGWGPFMMTAVFTGLRASELRGLRWEDVDLNKGELHVNQRADPYRVMGSPKSAAGQRTIPMPPTVVQELREWKLRCPKPEGWKVGLVFPNGIGEIEIHANLVRRGLIPTVEEARLFKPVLDENGIPKRDDHGGSFVSAKYTGLHALRHFFAFWCINRKEDGGLALPAKVVQERMGHSSITMTMDVYGHLFPRGDDSAELAKAERLLLGM